MICRYAAGGSRDSWNATLREAKQNLGHPCMWYHTESAIDPKEATLATYNQQKVKRSQIIPSTVRTEIIT
eukprot:3091729-Amphidinium_carterae.1